MTGNGYHTNYLWWWLGDDLLLLSYIYIYIYISYYLFQLEFPFVYFLLGFRIQKLYLFCYYSIVDIVLFFSAEGYCIFCVWVRYPDVTTYLDDPRCRWGYRVPSRIAEFLDEYCRIWRYLKRVPKNLRQPNTVAVANSSWTQWTLNFHTWYQGMRGLLETRPFVDDSPS